MQLGSFTGQVEETPVDLLSLLGGSWVVISGV